MIQTISPSKLSLWFKCGEAFRFRYLDNLKIPPKIVAHRGKAVHKAAEINHRQKIDSQKDLPLDSLQDACRDEFVKKCKEGVFIPPDDRAQKNKLLNEGLNKAILMTESYKKNVAPQIWPKYVEKTFSYDIGLTYPLLGITDVIDIYDQIQDIKTGDKSKPENWENNELQPPFYALLFQRIKGTIPLFYYHVITLKKIQILTPKCCLEFDQFLKSTNQLVKYIQKFEQDLQAGIFKPAEPGHWLCTEKWCGYYPICKYKQ